MNIDSEVKKSDNQFQFNVENQQKIQEILQKYPIRFSAVMPILDLAQRQNGGFLTQQIFFYVAEILQMPYIKVYEVATFYTIYNLQPIGKYLVQLCRTTPCWLCGSNAILEACTEELGIEIDQTTSDSLFTLKEVECLGACINAPVAQINDDYYENLTAEKIKEILQDLRKKG